MNKDIIVIGCAVHIILNNAMQSSADTLPIDIHVIIGKYFNILIFIFYIKEYKNILVSF